MFKYAKLKQTQYYKVHNFKRIEMGLGKTFVESCDGDIK